MQVKENRYMRTSRLQRTGRLELNCSFFSKAMVSILVQAPVSSQMVCWISFSTEVPPPGEPTIWYGITLPLCTFVRIQNDSLVHCAASRR